MPKEHLEDDDPRWNILTPRVKVEVLERSSQSGMLWFVRWIVRHHDPDDDETKVEPFDGSTWKMESRLLLTNLAAESPNRPKLREGDGSGGGSSSSGGSRIGGSGSWQQAKSAAGSPIDGPDGRRRSTQPRHGGRLGRRVRGPRV